MFCKSVAIWSVFNYIKFKWSFILYLVEVHVTGNKQLFAFFSVRLIMMMRMIAIRNNTEQKTLVLKTSARTWSKIIYNKQYKITVLRWSRAKQYDSSNWKKSKEKKNINYTLNSITQLTSRSIIKIKFNREI